MLCLFAFQPYTTTSDYKEDWTRSLEFAKKGDYKNLSDSLSYLKDSTDNFITKINGQGWSILHYACASKNCECVSLCLKYIKKSDDLILTGPAQRSALMIAACQENSEIVEKIISHQAYNSTYGNYMLLSKKTALTLACENGLLKNVKLLLKKNINVRIKDFECARSSNIIQELLNHTFDLKQTDEFHNNCLHLNANPDAIKMFILCGADVEKKNLDKKTPLDYEISGKICAPSKLKIILLFCMLSNIQDIKNYSSNWKNINVWLSSLIDCLENPQKILDLKPESTWNLETVSHCGALAGIFSFFSPQKLEEAIELLKQKLPPEEFKKCIIQALFLICKPLPHTNTSVLYRSGLRSKDLKTSSWKTIAELLVINLHIKSFLMTETQHKLFQNKINNALCDCSISTNDL